MKNKEKYLDEILEAFTNVYVDNCDFRTKYVLKQKGCCEIRCNECNLKTAEWLEQEYKEPIELTDDEMVILKNIDKHYEWIARDNYGMLGLFGTKPEKEKGYIMV